MNDLVKTEKGSEKMPWKTILTAVAAIIPIVIASIEKEEK